MIRNALTFALLLLFAKAAFAQEAPTKPAERLSELMAEADTAYDAGQYRDAASKYVLVYELSLNVNVLYNVGQSLRLARDCTGALEAYEKYSASGQVRPELEDKVALFAKEMRECVEREKAAREAEAARARQPPTPVRDSMAGSGKRYLGLGTMGVGLALVATGVYFGLDARSAAGDVSDAIEAQREWTSALQDTEDRGKRSQTLAIVTWAAGAAALGGGAFLYYLGVREGAAAESAVSVAPTSGGLSLGYSLRF